MQTLNQNKQEMIKKIDLLWNLHRKEECGEVVGCPTCDELRGMVSDIDALEA